MIRLEKVEKLYRKGDSAVSALRGVDLEVQAGELVAIQGPSGSGKTTLLNLIGLLDEPSAGQVFLFGKDVSALSDREKSALRGSKIGFVFQSFNLISHLNAWENVALPLYYRGIGRKERRRRALAALEGVGLKGRAYHLPAELSGGEEQRVAIARALVTDPALILADEPTGNLDSHTGKMIMEEFLAINNVNGVTVLVATHDPLVVSFTRRVIELRDGQITKDSASEVVDVPRSGDGGF
jgi:putative ABC transport system ATP-binding protein